MKNETNKSKPSSLLTANKQHNSSNSNFDKRKVYFFSIDSLLISFQIQLFILTNVIFIRITQDSVNESTNYGLVFLTTNQLFANIYKFLFKKKNQSRISDYSDRTEESSTPEFFIRCYCGLVQKAIAYIKMEFQVHTAHS